MTQSPNPTATTHRPSPSTTVDPRVIDKLRKILALTDSPEEGEATAAAEMLQKFLVQHNLSVSDLESKGAARAAVTESAIELGHAGFRWKLDLAEEIAEFYFCVGIVKRHSKRVTFVGRPDNVESLKMLYGWVIEQIIRLSREARKQHQTEHGEHIDPLRWQLAFGSGAVGRLIDRLTEGRKKVDANTTALVLHHSKEISDYTEAKYNQRYDGQRTEADKKWDADYEKRKAEWAEQRAKRDAEDAQLLATDPVTYYQRYPDRHPDVVAEAQRREARNAARRARYVPRGRWSRGSYDYDKDDQQTAARKAGHSSADKINLEPFLTGHTPAGDLKKGGK